MPILLKGTIKREVHDSRQYTVDVTPAGVMIGEKGRRGKFGPVSWDAIYALGAKQEAASAAIERATDKPRRVRRGVINP